MRVSWMAPKDGGRHRNSNKNWNTSFALSRMHLWSYIWHEWNGTRHWIGWAIWRKGIGRFWASLRWLRLLRRRWIKMTNIYSSNHVGLILNSPSINYCKEVQATQVFPIGGPTGEHRWAKWLFHWYYSFQFDWFLPFSKNPGGNYSLEAGNCPLFFCCTRMFDGPVQH